MKRSSLLVLFVILAGNVSAERSPAPPATPASLSFSLAPNATLPFGRDGSLGNLAASLPFGAPNVGGTISCRYRPRSSSLFIGVEAGYMYMTLYDTGEHRSGNLSMLQAGLSAGVTLNILPTAGMRLFGSAGYSYDLVQPLVSDDEFHNFLRLNNSTADGGTPFVGAGAELFWTFIPSLSLTAGAAYRSYIDLYNGLVLSLGVSCDLPVGPRPVKPSAQRAAPLKRTSPQTEHRPEAPSVAKLLQFLTPNEEALLSFSTRVGSCVEPSVNRAIDKNLQSAMGLHEALRLLSIECTSSPSDSSATMDPVKFPLQTLQDRRGTCSDLSALYISLLESIGVPTAFISTPGHVYVAFALASSGEETQKTCGYSDELLFREGKAWVPVEVTDRQGSFLSAWQAGLEQWRKDRKQARFCPVRAARKAESTTVSVGGQPPLPDLAQLAGSFQEEVRCLVAREIHDREGQLAAAVTSSNSSAMTLNALGLLYARSDVPEKAEAQFQAAAERLEYAPALVNLGNLRLLAGVPAEALGFYQRAAAVAPNDPAVLLGLARSNFQLHNRWLAKEQHRTLQTRNPKLAEQFSYLSLWGEWAKQDAGANRMKNVMVWGEEK